MIPKFSTLNSECIVGRLILFFQRANIEQNKSPLTFNVNELLIEVAGIFIFWIFSKFFRNFSKFSDIPDRLKKIFILFIMFTFLLLIVSWIWAFAMVACMYTDTKINKKIYYCNLQRWKFADFLTDQVFLMFFECSTFTASIRKIMLTLKHMEGFRFYFLLK